MRTPDLYEAACERAFRRFEEIKELRTLNDELLEACKAMRRTMYSDKSRESIMADAAIAKAAAMK